MDKERAERLVKKYSRMETTASKKQINVSKNAALRAHAMSSTEKPRDIKGTVRRLAACLAKDRIRMITAIIFSVIYTVATLASAYMLRPIMNNYIYKDGHDLRGLALGLCAMAGVYASGALAQWLQQRIMLSVSQRTLRRMRKDLYDKLQTLPVRYFDTHATGDVMSRFTNDVDTIGEMLNSTLIQIVSGAITIAGTLVLMLYTNLWLALITIVMTPVLIFISRAIIKRGQGPYKKQQKALGTLDGFAEEMITGQKVVKIFNQESVTEDEFEYLNDELRGAQVKAQICSSMMGPLTHNLCNLTYALTACVGGILVVAQGFDIGGVTVFVNYTRHFNRPINEIAMQMNTVFAALAGAERVFQVMDETPEEPDKDAVQPEKLDGHVVMEHVNFGYTPDKTILHDISLYAKPGQRIAFVGSTGAGKTTVTNLLSRFYEIAEGKITIDGIPIERIERSFLRKNIAMVLQDTHLFTGTVRENIRYGRLDATDEEVTAAARVASAHSFIVRLEHGYDTVLENDGANLSQGQRQLLNIARAAVSHAPILILDEATSSVDTRTERHIEEGMDALMKNRTTLVIAHRLSTVRTANAIMVLEHGNIIERGDHETLLKMRGRYADLYNEIAELE